MKDRVSRRSFLKRALGAVAGAMTYGSMSETLYSWTVAYDPRPRIPNPYVTPDGKCLLVCVEGTDYRRMLQKGLDILGGLQRLINDNQDVLIKPNCNYRDPYPGISNVSGIRALVCEAVNATAGTVSVADQGFEHGPLVYEYLNLEHPVTSAGGNLESLNTAYPVRAAHWAPEIPDHWVYSRVYDAPIIINTCCIKRHMYANMSCALKNNVGAVAGPNAESTRGYLHSLGGDSFQEEIAEIAGLINPELNVVDARAILTVNGPHTSQGLVKNVNKVIICGDIVATDIYCRQLLAEHDATFSPSSVAPLLQHAFQLGLGTTMMQQMEIIETTE